jgi:NitT/TauT family transport system substrate-binding protein
MAYDAMQPLSRRRFVAGGAAFGAALALPQRARAAKTLTAGYVPATLFAPVFAAADRGYFSSAGLSVQLTPIVAGQDALALLATGRLDFIAAGLSAAFFNACARDLDVRYVASTGYQPRHEHPSALLVRTDLYEGGLRSPAGLRGRKVAWIGGAGATSAYYVARILRPAGLRLSDIDPVNIGIPDQGVAFGRKAIDAAFTSTPSTEAFTSGGLARFLAAPPAGIAATGIFYGPNLLNDRDTARAVLEACRRGGTAVAGDAYYSKENLATFARYTQQPVEILANGAHYDFVPDLRVDQVTLEDMQREFVSQGLLTYQTPLDASRLVARF